MSMGPDLIAQFLYCTWRLELWDLGYGTYDDIDRDVAVGKLRPGVIPEDLRAKRWKARGDGTGYHIKDDGSTGGSDGAVDPAAMGGPGPGADPGGA